MEYNVAKERMKFFAEQDRLAKEYRKAGMTEEQIKEMFDYDYEAFKKERVFREHNNFIDLEAFEKEHVPEEKASILGHYFDRFSNEFIYQTQDRYGWLDEIGDPDLYKELKKLSENDLELLTLYVIDGYSLSEIALIQGISKQAVGKKTLRMKKILKKIWKKG